MDTLATKRWPVIATLLLAVAGIVSPILWDILRSNPALELKQTGRTTLIQRNESFEKLRIEYDGKPVKELASVRFTLANIGSKPIRDTDLVAPPTLHFDSPNSVLDARIEDSFPPNLAATITRLPKPEDVSLSFPLLNPGDNIQFVVLVGQAAPVTFRADARIVGVSQLKVATQVEAPARTKKRTSWTVYPVGYFSALLLFGTLGLLTNNIPKERRFKQSILDDKPLVQRNSTKEAALKYATSALSWTTAQGRKAVISFLETMPTGRVLENAESERLETLMRDYSRAATSNASVAMIASVLAIIGVAYVIIQLI